MESNEILTSLAKLEASLNEIESAKEQVKKTIGAYTSVQKQIGEYVKSLNQIAGGVSTIMSALKSQKDSLNEDASHVSEVLNAKTAEMISLQNNAVAKIMDSLKVSLNSTKDSFSSDCLKIVDSIKQNYDTEIKKLEDQVVNLETCIANLNALHKYIEGSLEAINEVMKEICSLRQTVEISQNFQNGQLETIRAGLESLSSRQSKTINSLSVDMKNAQGVQNKVIADMSATVQSLSRKLEENNVKLAKGHTQIIIMVIISILTIIAVAIIK